MFVQRCVDGLHAVSRWSVRSSVKSVVTKNWELSIIQWDSDYG